MNLKRPILFLFLFFLSYAACSFAGEENITFTTYYPSPKGVYKSLRLYPDINERRDPCNNNGEMYYYEDTVSPAVYICSQHSWSRLPGKGGGGGNFWELIPPTNQDIRTTSAAWWGASVGTLANSGYGLRANDVFLRDLDGGKWFGDAIREYGWDLHKVSSDNMRLYYSKGKVGIGTQQPGARLTIQGQGQTSATSSLRVASRITGQEVLFVRDDGNVGIGAGNPEARLHIVSQPERPGALRINDGSQDIDNVLTSDNQGLASWQTQTDNRLSGGLYGYCVEDNNKCVEAGLPASCDGGSCICKSGYELVPTDTGRYVCYKL